MWEDRVHGLHYTAANTSSSTTTTTTTTGATIVGGDTAIGLLQNPTTILPWAVNPSAYSLPHHAAAFNGDFYHPERNFAAFGASTDHQADLSGLHIGSSTERLLHGKAGTMSIFGSLHAEFGKMTAKEIMDAKALAASKSHSEAERRRRQRINGHLAKLRSLLPNTTKTDKASLLAEVIEHVKELKRQTSTAITAEGGALLLPTEADELTVDAAGSDEDGRLVVRASLCCDDRSDLIPDLARALKTLKLRARRAEIATLCGRVKNVLIITARDDDVCPSDCVAAIQETLRAVMDKKTATSDTSSSSSGIKRQRTNRGDEQQGSI